MNITIELQNNKKFTGIPTHSQCQSWVEKTLTTAPNAISQNKKTLTIRIVDEAESTLLNETYRHKKGPTNILSFQSDPIPGFAAESLGDLAICAPLVVKEATLQHKKIAAHWAHLLIHGVLHLLEYDHMRDEDAQVMEALEIKILHDLGFANPY